MLKLIRMIIGLRISRQILSTIKREIEFPKKTLLYVTIDSFSDWVKGISFHRNCGAASVGEWYTKIWFINGVDNVNWPPYRDWKADVSSVSPSSIRSDEGLTLETSAFQSLYGGQFTLSTPLINQIFIFRLLYMCCDWLHKSALCFDSAKLNSSPHI